MASATQSPPTPMPPIPKTDTFVHGWLRPAYHLTPPNKCSDDIPEGSVRLLICDNTMIISKYGKVIILMINGCEALGINRDERGTLLNTVVNDGSGVPPATIVNNEIVAENGENYSSRQSSDDSTLTVTNREGQTLLHAEFLNKSTMRITGRFGCTGGLSVPVVDDQPIPGVHMSGSCIGGFHSVFSIIVPPTPQAY